MQIFGEIDAFQKISLISPDTIFESGQLVINIGRSMNEKECKEIAAILALPADAFLKTSEAAIFLRSSTGSLEVMRRDGTGPTYFQPIRRKGQGANRACLYQIRDLIDWVESSKVGSVRESTIRFGKT